MKPATSVVGDWHTNFIGTIDREFQGGTLRGILRLCFISPSKTYSNSIKEYKRE